MNKETQLKHLDEFTSKMKEVIMSKGDDYAGADRLSNFKVAGKVAGILPEQNCLTLIGTKVARLGELLKGKEPKHESVQDSILDGANYFFLLSCLMSEGTILTKQETKIHIKETGLSWKQFKKQNEPMKCGGYSETQIDRFINEQCDFCQPFILKI